MVLAAIEAGHVYSTIEGVGGPGALMFTATNAAGTVSMGDDSPSPAMLRVDVDGPEDARIDLYRGGTIVTSGTGPVLEHATDAGGGPDEYRAEVSVPGAPGQPPIPWIVSNPIYVGGLPHSGPAPVRPAAAEFAVQYSNGPAGNWAVEASNASLGAIDVVPAVGGTQLALRYAVGGTQSSSPYAAFAMPAGAIAEYDRIVFTAHADRPTRMSVQLRQPGDEDGLRWQRSVYLDTDARDITVFFDDMKGRGPAAGSVPNLANVQSVLFVLDTINTKLGGRGQIWLDEIRYGR
jgi:hypothetical protein